MNRFFSTHEMDATVLGSHGNGATSTWGTWLLAVPVKSFRWALVNEQNFKNAKQLTANRAAGGISCINDDTQ